MLDFLLSLQAALSVPAVIVGGRGLVRAKIV